MHHPFVFFNTLTRKKEPFVPIDNQKVKLYTCGPTVYNFAHIGNLRTYIFEDLLKRSLLFMGYPVEHVMNLTDIDDKTLLGAIKAKVPLKVYTQQYIDAFFEDLKTLNILPANHYPAATDYIPQMVLLIQKLMDKGYAYQGKDHSVYFSIQAYPGYGALSHLNLEDLQVGERVEADEYDKESASDFVLWKAYDPQRDGDIFWESPWGKGRPGWHIECSCMAMDLLGEELDIHCGGVDNIFPHHENEIAQSEGCTGKVFSRYWLHSEHLIVDNKKMSKSLGNFYTLKDLLAKGFCGSELRYLLLQTHYKTPLNFTLEGLKAARSSLKRIQDFLFRLDTLPTDLHKAFDPSFFLEDKLKAFKKALCDDLNIAVALACLFEVIKEMNRVMDEGSLNVEGGEKIKDFFKTLDPVLGIYSLDPQEASIPQDLQEALERRIAARKEKNWALADELRDLIVERGFSIEDGPEGSYLKKIEKGADNEK